ncbi:hypothetical protein BD410DRAFT_156907 [Rickenella mellea]|uniref:Uncharacterized protein n=1 Tax=Rickenella mellea TaxID=50990 RepID=A0A4Y7PJ21_9AGAM|nr:hypothetical protein BD410DRAFT_156907 [Rickenella mellea]
MDPAYDRLASILTLLIFRVNHGVCSRQSARLILMRLRVLRQIWLCPPHSSPSDSYQCTISPKLSFHAVASLVHCLSVPSPPVPATAAANCATNLTTFEALHRRRTKIFSSQIGRRSLVTCLYVSLCFLLLDVAYCSTSYSARRETSYIHMYI